MNTNLEKILTEATDGLLYPSESDYPFEYVEWDLPDSKSLTEEQVRRCSGQSSDAPVVVQSLDKLFGQLTEVKDWYGEEETKTAGQYAALKEKLEKELTDIQVFRIGSIETDVFIIGKFPAGKWAGLKTKAVET
jgi:hypothetical protein